MVDESKLELALRDCWTRESSADPVEWSAENPAWGQCAVTGAVVNDYLGGELVWAYAVLPHGEKISHYFNKIGGVEKDYTRCQFPEGTLIPEGIPKLKEFSSTREFVLSFQATQNRYDILRKRVMEYLAAHE